MRKYWKVGLLTAWIFAIAAVASPKLRSSAVTTTTTAIQRLQPFVVMQTNWDTSATPTAVGGIVKYYIAKSTDTLNICDLVAIDTLGAVTKSATLAAYNKEAGVVVGGRSTSMQASVAAADCGQRAALPNRPVIVLRQGRFWAQLDSTTGGVTAGGLIAPSVSTAGKVRAKPAALDSLLRVVGRSVLGSAINSTILVEINAK